MEDLLGKPFGRRVSLSESTARSDTPPTELTSVSFVGPMRGSKGAARYA